MSIRSLPTHDSQFKLASIRLQKQNIDAQIPELFVTQEVAKFNLSLYQECLKERNPFVSLKE